MAVPIQSDREPVERNIPYSTAQNNAENVWSRVSCEALSSEVSRVKSAFKPPEHFPEPGALDQKINQCAGNLNQAQAAELYDRTFSLQDEWKDFTPNAAYDLQHKTDGKPLTPSEKNRVKAIGVFEENPEAAQILAKKLDGAKLDPTEDAKLTGAYEFTHQVLAAKLAASQLLGQTTSAEDQLLEQFRRKKPVPQGEALTS